MPRKLNLYTWLTRAVYITLACVIIATYKDYGISWDELRQQGYGERILLFFTSGFKDQAALHFHNLAFYGGFYDTAAILLQKLCYTADIYELRHLLTAVFGLFSIIGTGRLATLLSGPRTGLLAVTLLTTLPLYYGHMFINTKDIPFACGYVWSLYYLCKIVLANHDRWLTSGFKLGIVLGLTLATRIGAALFFFYFVVTVLGLILLRLKHHTDFQTVIRKQIPAFLVATCIAYIAMLCFWPYALLNPINGPMTAYQEMAKFRTSGTVLIAGQFIQASQPPYWYLPHIMFVQLPETFLGLIACSIGFTIYTFLRSLKLRKALINQRMLCVALIALSAIFPVCFAILKKSTLYDNFRHFLFVIPPLTILCAFCINAMADARPVLGRYLVIGVCAISSVVALQADWALHPYQYVYYNHFAKNAYELDYWATGFKEAARELNHYVESHFPDQAAPHLVSSSAPTEVMEIYIASYPKLKYVKDRNKAQFHVALVRDDYDSNIPGKNIASVSRAGLDFINVYDLNTK